MKLLIRLAIIASLGILMANCSDKKSGETTNEKVAVKSMTVEKGPIAPSDSYIGNVVESQSSTLSFEVPGNIKEVLVKEGQKVAKGQLLAILNKGNIANNYWIAASTLKQAQDNYNRTAMLYQNKSIPQIQYVDAKTQLSKAKYAEQAAKKDLNDCYLYAPFSGIIGERSIEPGMNISAGYPILKLLKTNILEVKVSIPENKIEKIHVGSKAKITINALNNVAIQGFISQKGIIGNAMSHTYEIKITLVNPSPNIMPGMLCNVEMVSNNTPHAIVVPVNCIQLFEDNSQYVWIINSHHTYLRKVTVGHFVENGVIIRSGLNIGDRIVTEGFQKIGEGCEVIDK